MLAEPESWDQLTIVGESLKRAAEVIASHEGKIGNELRATIDLFVFACSSFADTLLTFHEILEKGDLDVIQQRLEDRNTLIDVNVRSTPRRLHTANLPIALDATNALADMRIAKDLLNEAEEFLGIGLLALLADAGGGKTQLAAQITAPQVGRPAGILLHGRDLHKGQTLDDLAHHFKISGAPVNSMERLIASLDSAGKRAGCRLPILIDGLNEAENPYDWKPALAMMNEVIKKYPYVMIVCTLRTGERQRNLPEWEKEKKTKFRESFAIMALPEGIRRIESEGFGRDVDDAIDKYFKYFRINTGDAEIPVELLQHPLTLRIFCEVSNPKRESEVSIGYFPASLSPLFDEYVMNACKRIAQLPNQSHCYSPDEIQSAVYNLGIELWESNQREISEKKFRATVSDTERPWNSSIVNLLAQEGIIFRNPGDVPGECEITPIYDALGGYLIASALLDKHRKDRDLEWTRCPETLSSFLGENSHKLASDIFSSLVSLVPRRIRGKQLWKELPDPLRHIALIYTTTLEAEYLDKETIDAIFKIMTDNPKRNNYLLSRFREIRAVSDHPFNARFLDRILRDMPVAQRDLIWTEWVRETRQERLNELLSLEGRFRHSTSSRLESDRLRAIWIMWLLTSTDRELRDIATRTLYWFGRGDADTFFDESVKSLSINDPYVPERMLAASYGVAMAKHIEGDNDTFRQSILPKYAHRLYESLFAPNAPFCSTHILLREYASRTIELTMFYEPSHFNTDEAERSRPPFKDGTKHELCESTKAKDNIYGLDSPFRIDFENYTLGSLVPGRRNYDENHKGYQKVRAQVLWRVEQLGWSSTLFRDVDNAIEREKHWSRTASNAKRVERYGKKYSWIAYYEIAGFLHDKAALASWMSPRSFLDIDPSFPDQIMKGNVIDTDFLGEREIKTEEWIVNGPMLNLNRYLVQEKVQQEIGPWILLDGYFTQEDKNRGRRLFCFIRSFLVPFCNADLFVDHLSKQNLGGRWLPEKPSVSNAFAGEIPWCNAFIPNSQCEFSFVTSEKLVTVKKKKKEYYLDGKKLGISDIDVARVLIFHNLDSLDKDKKSINKEDLDRIESKEIDVNAEEVERSYTKFNAIIPVCDINWDGDRSAANYSGHATTLAKEISHEMKLRGRPQTFDLFDQDGEMVTLNVSDHSNDISNYQSMFFIKEDLIRSYLTKKDYCLVWAIWGEREYSLNKIEMFFNREDKPKQAYSVYSYVKRYNKT
jgi:hypothetical protein